MTVDSQKAGTKPATPAMPLAMVADKSKAANVVVEGTCPGMGASWIYMEPRNFKSALLGSATDVRTAAGKFVAGQENAHKGAQWCSVAVAAAA